MFDRQHAHSVVGRSGQLSTIPACSHHHIAYSMVRGLLLLGASSFSAAVGCLGCALLAYALGTHLLAPGAASTSRDLYFDLTQPAPVATASFLQQDLNSLRALSKVGADEMGWLSAPATGYFQSPQKPHAPCCRRWPKTCDSGVQEIRWQLLCSLKWKKQSLAHFRSVE